MRFDVNQDVTGYFSKAQVSRLSEIYVYMYLYHKFQYENMNRSNQIVCDRLYLIDKQYCRYESIESDITSDGTCCATIWSQILHLLAGRSCLYSFPHNPSLDSITNRGRNKIAKIHVRKCPLQ